MKKQERVIEDKENNEGFKDYEDLFFGDDSNE